MIQYTMEKQQIVGIVILIIFSMMVLGLAEITNPPIILTSSIIETMEVAGVSFENFDDLTNTDEISVAKMSIEDIDNAEDIIQPTEEEIVENSENNVSERSEKLNITRGGNLKLRTAGIKPVEEIAKEVFNGKYGNGIARKERLEALGYNYEEIQKEVDKLMPSKPIQQYSSNTPTPSSQTIPAHSHSTFKSYMAWTALSPSSPQGKLCAKATKDNNTAIMMYEGRYLVALGKAYGGPIGEKIDVVMESGKVIPVMVGDWKANIHTDQHNSTTTHDGSIIEFIVSSNKEAAQAVNGSGNYNVIFPGKVKEFRK